MESTMIYMDNAATTMHKPKEVIDAVVAAMSSMGNAGRGVNEASLSASRLIYDTREKLCRLFGAEDPRQIVFTANSTESLNIAIKGILNPGDHVIATMLEHNSVLRPLYEMEKKGVRLTIVKSNPEGTLDLADIENAIAPDTKMIVCTNGSNLTGNYIDPEPIGTLAREKGIVFVVDASQTAGVFPIDVQKMKIDLLTMSGHKIHGPKGVGMVYMRKGLKVRPFILGGGQQKGQRAGTENGAGVAGLGVAADVAFRSMKESIEHVKEVKKTLMDGILAMPDTQVNGDGLEEASPYVLNVTFKGLRSEVLLHSLESKGIFVSAGSACDSRKKIGSPVLTAMGMPFEEIEGAVRFSFCRYNTVEEAKECLKALEETVPFLRKINRQR